MIRIRARFSLFVQGSRQAGANLDQLNCFPLTFNLEHGTLKRRARLKLPAIKPTLAACFFNSDFHEPNRGAREFATHIQADPVGDMLCQ